MKKFQTLTNDLENKSGRLLASKKEVEVALCGFTDADLRKLERIARFRTIGLTEFDWLDLLQEAIVRLLEGKRQWPKDVGFVVFLRETMRSIASDHWRRRSINPTVSESHLRDLDEDLGESVLESAPDPMVNLEQDAALSETLSRIEHVFRKDPKAMHVIEGMAMGKSPHEIRERGQMDAKEYASTQKRIRRTLANAFPDRGQSQ